MRVAFVYDRVTKWGGAEQVLLALHRIWPTAPLYTAVYNRSTAKWADVFTVHASFLNRIPMANRIHEFLPWLTPMAFESFNFDAYDVVISITSAEAKGVITKPGTVHICYCLTPTRYLWSGSHEYQKNPGLGMMNFLARMGLVKLASTLKRWDLVSASRPDYYIAISNAVKARITQYYKRDTTEVIYPPVDTHVYTPQKATKGYFLTVSRLVGYKRVDLLIDAFNALGWPLVIVGVGRDKGRLERRARKNIRFVGEVSGEELVSYYQGCQAFVHAGEEDFGIAAVEAQSAGKPVIAYKKGGIGEIVIPGKTGMLFDTQTVSCLVETLQQFKQEWYDSALCEQNAQRFSTREFEKNMKVSVTRLYNKKTL
jgi:glycosyltransferase involved in cell wall biosynthesis